MQQHTTIPPIHTLILGGQKSGKSRQAEMLARDWLAAAPTHRATLIATAEAHDAEMAARIAQHQADRAQRVPQLQTVEEPLALAERIQTLSSPSTLLVVECLTLWLTNQLMPVDSTQTQSPAQVQAAIAELSRTLRAAPGPVVFVSNEISLGIIPLMPAVRQFVDQLGLLNQSMASQCQRVLLMAAGLPLALKAAS